MKLNEGFSFQQFTIDMRLKDNEAQKTGQNLHTSDGKVEVYSHQNISPLHPGEETPQNDDFLYNLNCFNEVNGLLDQQTPGRSGREVASNGSDIHTVRRIKNETPLNIENVHRI